MIQLCLLIQMARESKLGTLPHCTMAYNMCGPNSTPKTVTVYTQVTISVDNSTWTIAVSYTEQGMGVSHLWLPDQLYLSDLGDNSLQLINGINHTVLLAKQENGETTS